MKNQTASSIPLTRIQKLIGKRMLDSKRNKPCFYVRLKADITELMGMRHKLKKSLGIRITTNTFFIHALAQAVNKFPLMVGKLEGNKIKIAESINVGFAVNTPLGVVVPVIRNADKKSLAEIAPLEKELTDKARSNKITLEEIEGETIALSNLGAYGVDAFVGIVPPPATTILSVGNALRQAVPENGWPVRKNFVNLSLAVDYRVTTGTYAAGFLNYIKELLQEPQKLL